MPNTEQISARLFKRDLGIGDTNTSRYFFEEPFLGGIAIKPSQILAQFNQVPSTAPVGMVNDDIVGVVQRKIDLVLTAVPGTTNAFQHNDLKDAIPFNFGDGSYNYQVKNSLDAAIAFGQGDWVIDTVAGILIFYGAVPSNMPPKISFYKYVGTKGTGTASYVISTNLTARNDIPPEDRVDGLMCYVQSEKKIYQLQGGITNGDWKSIGDNSILGIPMLDDAVTNIVLGSVTTDRLIQFRYLITRNGNYATGFVEMLNIDTDVLHAELIGRITYGDTPSDVSDPAITFDATTNVDDIRFSITLDELSFNGTIDIFDIKIITK